MISKLVAEATTKIYANERTLPAARSRTTNAREVTPVPPEIFLDDIHVERS